MAENLTIEEFIRNLFVDGKITANPPDNPFIFAIRIDHVDADTLNSLNRFLYSKGIMNPLIDVKPSGNKISVRVFLR
jgi:hypothetical protein